jgi:hypothetical protein
LNASLVSRVRVRGVWCASYAAHTTLFLISNPPDTDLLIGAGSSDLTPLYLACELANADLVNLLLKKGQPINTRVRTQETRGVCRVCVSHELTVEAGPVCRYPAITTGRCCIERAPTGTSSW